MCQWPPCSLQTSSREQALLGCDLTWSRSTLEEKMSYALFFTEWINQFYNDDKESVGDQHRCRCPFLVSPTQRAWASPLAGCRPGETAPGRKRRTANFPRLDQREGLSWSAECASPLIMAPTKTPPRAGGWCVTAGKAVADGLTRPTTQAWLPLGKAEEMCGWWLLLFSPLSAHTTTEL